MGGRAASSSGSNCGASSGASRRRGVLDSIRRASAVILAPSNPFVSIGPILGLNGRARGARAVRERVAAISPIVGGKPIKGPADKMMRGFGHEVSPLGYRPALSRFRRSFCL